MHAMQCMPRRGAPACAAPGLAAELDFDEARWLRMYSNGYGRDPLCAALLRCVLHMHAMQCMPRRAAPDRAAAHSPRRARAQCPRASPPPPPMGVLRSSTHRPVLRLRLWAWARSLSHIQSINTARGVPSQGAKPVLSAPARPPRPPRAANPMPRRVLYS